MTIGDKIKRIRDLLNITQVEMAEKLEIGQQALSHLESGRNAEMSFPVYKRLVKKLGVNPYYILQDGNGEPEFSPKGKDVNKALRDKIKEYEKLIDQLRAVRVGSK